MHYKSVSNLWNRIAGRRAPQATDQVEEFDIVLDQAWETFRREPVSVPPWENIERLIHNRAKEHVMSPISRATIFGISRKVAWIAATSAAVMLAFFTVPFSQSNPVGARILFEFSPPLTDGGLCDRLANCSSSLMGEAQFGITNCNIQVQKTEEGISRLELLVLTETGIVPDELVNTLTAQYPELANAQLTIAPIEERSAGTLFDNFVGNKKISLHCEGMTVEEITAQIKAQLAAQGAPDAEVQVEKVGDSNRVKVKVCVKDTMGQQ